MRFFFRVFFHCIVLCIPTIQAQHIVVTDDNHPVYNLPDSIRVIKLDAATRLHEELSANLPDVPEQAEHIAKERLNQANGLQQAIQLALQGAIDAWSLGITKIPAVVIDDYVVYGETNVKQALFEIEAYRNQKE